MSRGAKDAAFDALADLPADMTASHVAVWLWIANRQNDATGYAWSSHADIAAHCRITADHVGRVTGELETAGFLAVERRRGRTNRYRIVIPNHRDERGGTEHLSAVMSAGGTALSAVPPRAERGRNQLENQLMNLAPLAPCFTCAECGGPSRAHRWRCDRCQEMRTG